MDDSGNQWQGEEPDKIWQLQESTDMWEEEVEKLKLFDSVDKRALLLTHKSMLQFIRGVQAYKRIIFKSQHTYLGFDIFSGSPFAVGRKTSSKRLGVAKKRTTKVRILQKAVRGGSGRLLGEESYPRPSTTLKWWGLLIQS